MFARLLGEDFHRWWLGSRCPPGPLKTYYRTDTPTLDSPWTRVGFLAIDIETTGLDADTDEIVSFGWVPVEAGRIRLAEAARIHVRPTRPMGREAATVHGLLDDRLALADPIDAVMPKVLAALTGRIPIAHHARIERDFLSRACRRLYGRGLEVPYIDTLALERRLMQRRDAPMAEGALRLATCRWRYGLPRYKPHDALSDALAAAELFLVQATIMSGRQPAQLRDLLH